MNGPPTTTTTTVLGKQTVAEPRSACPEGEDVDRRASAWARTRHGLIVPAEIAATEQEVRTRRDTGRWQPLFPGVFGMAGSPDTDEKALLAACLGAKAVGSHRAALWAWDMTGRRLEVVEVSVTRPHAPRLPGVVIHRSLDLERAHVSERHGIPVTNPLRTLVDAGAVLPKLLVADALDAAVARRLVTATAVEAELARLAKKGRRGAGVLRAVLEERDCVGRSPSVLEARSRRMLAGSSLPPSLPELIAGPHREFRLDFAWPEVLLDVEVDGWEWHSSYAAVRLGKQRNNTLVAMGYAILQYDWKDITRRPAAVRREIEATYWERAALLGKQTVA
jgi:hypothetical protein